MILISLKADFRRLEAWVNFELMKPFPYTQLPNGDWFIFPEQILAALEWAGEQGFLMLMPNSSDDCDVYGAFVRHEKKSILIVVEPETPDPIQA